LLTVFNYALIVYQHIFMQEKNQKNWPQFINPLNWPRAIKALVISLGVVFGISTTDVGAAIAQGPSDIHLPKTKSEAQRMGGGSEIATKNMGHLPTNNDELNQWVFNAVKANHPGAPVEFTNTIASKWITDIQADVSSSGRSVSEATMFFVKGNMSQFKASKRTQDYFAGLETQSAPSFGGTTTVTTPEVTKPTQDTTPGQVPVVAPIPGGSPSVPAPSPVVSPTSQTFPTPMVPAKNPPTTPESKTTPGRRDQLENGAKKFLQKNRSNQAFSPVSDSNINIGVKSGDQIAFVDDNDLYAKVNDVRNSNQYNDAPSLTANIYKLLQDENPNVDHDLVVAVMDRSNIADVVQSNFGKLKSDESFVAIAAEVGITQDNINSAQTGYEAAVKLLKDQPSSQPNDIYKNLVLVLGLTAFSATAIVSLMIYKGLIKVEAKDKKVSIDLSELHGMGLKLSQKTKREKESLESHSTELQAFRVENRFDDPRSMGTTNGEIWFGTDQGMKSGANEDGIVVNSDGGFIVIDGMGGYNDGDKAMGIIADLYRADPSLPLSELADTATQLFKDAQFDPKTGAPVIKAEIKNGVLIVESIGDCSVIVADKDGKLKFVARNTGFAKNCITAITSDPSVLFTVLTSTYPLSPGDRVIGYTDGLGDNFASQSYALATNGFEDLPKSLEESLAWEKFTKDSATLIASALASSEYGIKGGLQEINSSLVSHMDPKNGGKRDNRVIVVLDYQPQTETVTQPNATLVEEVPAVRKSGDPVHRLEINFMSDRRDGGTAVLAKSEVGAKEFSPTDELERDLVANVNITKVDGENSKSGKDRIRAEFKAFITTRFGKTARDIRLAAIYYGCPADAFRDTNTKGSNDKRRSLEDMTVLLLSEYSLFLQANGKVVEIIDPTRFISTGEGLFYNPKGFFNGKIKLSNSTRITLVKKSIGGTGVTETGITPPETNPIAGIEPIIGATDPFAGLGDLSVASTVTGNMAVDGLDFADLLSTLGGTNPPVADALPVEPQPSQDVVAPIPADGVHQVVSVESVSGMPAGVNSPSYPTADKTYQRFSFASFGLSPQELHGILSSDVVIENENQLINRIWSYCLSFELAQTSSEKDTVIEQLLNLLREDNNVNFKMLTKEHQAAIKIVIQTMKS
jgi:hypothetical protein